MKTEGSIPLYMSDETLKEVRLRFGYLLDRFDLKLLQGEVGSVDRFRYFTYSQVTTPVNGFRFGNLAYVTDIKSYPETIFDQLQGVKVLVLGAIHEQGSLMHFSFEEAIEFGRKTGVERVIFTHLAHEIEHELGNKLVPKGFELGYDGMVVDVR